MLRMFFSMLDESYRVEGTSVLNGLNPYTDLGILSSLKAAGGSQMSIEFCSDIPTFSYIEPSLTLHVSCVYDS